MQDEHYDPEYWRATYRAIPDWDQMFVAGRWAYLGELPESPRFALIAGYLHRIIGKGTVLDVGCGEGHLVRYLDLSRLAYQGFDISPNAIDAARRAYGEDKFTVASLETYEVSAGVRYDAVVLNEVAPHVAAPLEMIDGYLKVLRPGGVMLLSHFQSPDEKSNARRLTKILDAEIALGRYHVVAGVEVQNREGQKWRVTALR